MRVASSHCDNGLGAAATSTGSSTRYRNSGETRTRAISARTAFVWSCCESMVWR